MERKAHTETIHTGCRESQWKSDRVAFRIGDRDSEWLVLVMINENGEICVQSEKFDHFIFHVETFPREKWNDRIFQIKYGFRRSVKSIFDLENSIISSFSCFHYRNGFELSETAHSRWIQQIGNFLFYTFWISKFWSTFSLSIILGSNHREWLWIMRFELRDICEINHIWIF